MIFQGGLDLCSHLWIRPCNAILESFIVVPDCPKDLENQFAVPNKPSDDLVKDSDNRLKRSEEFKTLILTELMNTINFLSRLSVSIIISKFCFIDNHRIKVNLGKCKK